MSADGDLWERAVARGLPREQGALAIVRPSGLSLVIGGRRAFAGPCRASPFPRSGLYRARQLADGGLALAGLDEPADQGLIAPADGPGWRDLPLSGRTFWALVEQTDPAEHADS